MSEAQQVPFNIDAEEAVNGSLLIDGECLKEVQFLKPSDFFSSQNRLIFTACLECAKRYEAINIITVASELDRTRKLKDAGGAAYLSHLSGMVPTSLDAPYYAGIVHRLSIARGLINSASQIAAIGYEASPDTEGALSRATAILDTVKKEAGAMKSELVTPDMMGEKMLDMLNDGQSSISWGFADLDEVTTGIYPQDYIVIGARPSVGKTELQIEVAEKMAGQKKTVLFASTEMHINPVLERYIARALKISIRDLRKRVFDLEQQDKFMKAADAITGIPIYYLFGKRSSENIWMNARKMKEQYGLDAVFVDYLQLLTDCNKGKDNHAVQVGLVSHTLKAISQDLNVPVIVASQLNRLVEYREVKRPMLADLRESGDIEQDADVVFLLHRPELYPGFNAADKGVLELMMAKHRQLGQAEAPVKLQWVPQNHCYENKERES